MGVGSQLRAGCWRVEHRVTRIWAPTPIGGLTICGHPSASLAGSCARRRSTFLLRGQKKGTKEKATPTTCALRWRYGNLRCSPHGGMTQTRYAQTRVLLIPVGLRSSAHLEGDPGGRDRGRAAPHRA
jgi:hypothetical protein